MFPIPFWKATSLRWFENVDRYARQDALQFTFNMLVRSSRITYSPNPEDMLAVAVARGEVLLD